jgi:hypothetical protein
VQVWTDAAAGLSRSHSVQDCLGVCPACELRNLQDAWQMRAGERMASIGAGAHVSKVVPSGKTSPASVKPAALRSACLWLRGAHVGCLTAGRSARVEEMTLLLVRLRRRARWPSPAVRALPEEQHTQRYATGTRPPGQPKLLMVARVGKNITGCLNRGHLLPPPVLS